MGVGNIHLPTPSYTYLHPEKIVLKLLLGQGSKLVEAHTLKLYHLLKQFVSQVKQTVSTSETKSFSIFFP